MSDEDKKERLEKLSGAHVFWASLVGSSYDLGIMNQAIIVPAMKATAQRLVLHQMYKKLLPKFSMQESLDININKAMDALNEYLLFANHYNVSVSQEDSRMIATVTIRKDSCMFCPVGVGGGPVDTSVCPYPPLFSTYLDVLAKNTLSFLTPKMKKEEKGYMKKEPERCIMSFIFEEDEIFKITYEILKSSAERVQITIENALKDGKITEEDLWDRNYVPIENTNPQKYKTKFTNFIKTYIQPIEDEVLSMNKKFVFVVLVDENGYLPAHNSIYDKPLTGDYKKDLAGNRSMRIFNDPTGFAAAKNTDPILFQIYPRDLGKIMYDISMPIIINQKHWGALRVGFKD
ncbi:Methyl-accepting chemotaxis protein [Desulfurella amilsii]|uniref:Methyl-accepting chemotaxis protein n=1 Tax=Desulfurella amilsii TaxID=1562698 RepID=A0A1X4XZ20_9BACT|nr:hypothetical protein [Desulfurella amilsii]OSS42753.1 Methyl-accepting chemotaxis protein [Desulfurella amilsii]OSS42829.1 Methyl-accepting chemotaxis protein [Desulfurella amilsii]